MKNRILLENQFFPGDLEAKIEAFVDHFIWDGRPIAPRY